MPYGYPNYFNPYGPFTGYGNNLLFGLAPALLLPLLFTNNRRNVNIINVNTRRRGTNWC